MTFLRLPVLACLGLMATCGTARAESFATCAGFIDTLPAVITTQGTWCLRHDLATAITSGRAIEIAANNVTLDCNGFKIGGLAAGSASQAYGIYAHTRQNITVRNCTVRGFYYGAYLFGAGHLVEDNRFDNNLWTGIGVFGEASRVLRNLVVDTGAGDGVFLARAIHASADVIGNNVYDVMGDPGLANTSGWGIDIYQGRGRVVRDNNIGGLLYAGTGASRAIHVESAQGTVIRGNNMSRIGGGTSYGIQVESTGAFCNDNTIYNFSGPLDGCTVASGNQSLP